jgi:hypothetical protein
MSLPEGRRERLPAVFDGANPFLLQLQMSLDDRNVLFGKSRVDSRLVLVDNLFK